MHEAILLQSKPDHFDIWLREKLSEKAHDLQGCYVFPSIGGYEDHISGCDPTNAGTGGVGQFIWGEKNSVEGVRITTEVGGHRDRWVRPFLKKKALEMRVSRSCSATTRTPHWCGKRLRRPDSIGREMSFGSRF